MALGPSHSPYSVREAVKQALVGVSGLQLSPEIIDLDNLPEASLKSRAYTVLVSSSSSASLMFGNLTDGGQDTEYTIVLNYARLLNPTGTQEASLTAAYADLEAIYSALHASVDLGLIELAQLDQTGPAYHQGGDGMFIIFQQTYTAMAHRPFN